MMGCGPKSCYEDELEEQHKRDISKLKKHSTDKILNNLKSIDRNLHELYADRNLSMTKNQWNMLEYSRKTIKELLS